MVNLERLELDIVKGMILGWLVEFDKITEPLGNPVSK